MRALNYVCIAAPTCGFTYPHTFVNQIAGVCLFSYIHNAVYLHVHMRQLYIYIYISTWLYSTDNFSSIYTDTCRIVIYIPHTTRLGDPRCLPVATVPTRGKSPITCWGLAGIVGTTKMSCHKTSSGATRWAVDHVAPVGLTSEDVSNCIEKEVEMMKCKWWRLMKWKWLSEWSAANWWLTTNISDDTDCFNPGFNRYVCGDMWWVVSKTNHKTGDYI